MSSRLMVLAWEVKGLTPSQRLVFMSLADQSDNNGITHAAYVKNISDHIQLSERTVQYALGELLEASLIGVLKEDNQHQPRAYRLFPRGAEFAPLAPTSETARGAAIAPLTETEDQSRGATIAPLSNPGVQITTSRGATIAPNDPLMIRTYVPTTARAREDGGQPPEETPASDKRPLFTGQRLTVFPWMVDNLTQMLGPLADAFDLNGWFMQLDATAARIGQVIPRYDGGRWLEQQTLAEARRRGLPIAETTKHFPSPQKTSRRAPEHHVDPERERLRKERQARVDQIHERARAMLEEMAPADVEAIRAEAVENLKSFNLHYAQPGVYERALAEGMVRIVVENLARQPVRKSQ